MAANMSTDVSSDYIADAYSYRAQAPADAELTRKIAIALGYDPNEADALPQQANLGEGCGNPLAIAALKEGETVVDLGCGGGFDVFQASRKVGPTGRVIGIDASTDMLALAKSNAQKLRVSNVEFVKGGATHIPLPSNSVDCVISNCVLNLVPDDDKPAAITELYRILKPSGRLAMSDYLALKPLTAEMKADLALRAGCVSGAAETGWLDKTLRQTGFTDVVLVDKKINLDLYKAGETAVSVTPCCAGSKSCASQDTQFTDSGRKMLDYDLGEWISSFDIYVRKPATINSSVAHETLRHQVLDTKPPKQSCCAGAIMKSPQCCN